MAPNREWTPEVKQTFLDLLSASAVVTTAAELAGVSRAHAYRLREADSEFKRLWDEALQAAYDRFEKEAWRRAVKGVEKPVGFYMGEHGGPGEGKGTFVQEYSDTLLMFMLKGSRPEKFRDNIHHSGDATGGLAAQLARALGRRDEG